MAHLGVLPMAYVEQEPEPRVDRCVRCHQVLEPEQERLWDPAYDAYWCDRCIVVHPQHPCDACGRLVRDDQQLCGDCDARYDSDSSDDGTSSVLYSDDNASDTSP